MITKIEKYKTVIERIEELADKNEKAKSEKEKDNKNINDDIHNIVI